MNLYHDLLIFISFIQQYLLHVLILHFLIYTSISYTNISYTNISMHHLCFAIFILTCYTTLTDERQYAGYI